MKKYSSGRGFCLFCLFLFAASYVFAQDEFIKGSIVTSNHDTIYCFVKDRDLRETPTAFYKLKKTDEKAIKLKKEDYLRVQIGKTVYEKLMVTDSTDLGDGYLRSERVLKLMCNGHIKLYADIHNHGGSPMYGQYESLHIRKANESLIKINRLAHRSILKKYLSDMPDANSRIDNTSFDEIPQLVNTYNLWYLNK